MNNKNQQGASLIEFSLIAIIFFTLTFAAIAMGIDAYHRFVAGEEAEEVLKKVENTASVLTSVGNNTPSNLCGDAEEGCGFDIERPSLSCDKIIDGSAEAYCEHNNICIFWLSLYQIARHQQKDSSESIGYYYGKVNDEKCYASFAILFPGFETKNTVDEDNFTSGIKADGGSDTILQRIKNHEVAGSKKYVPSLLDNIFRRKSRGVEIAHYGYIRTSGKSKREDVIIGKPTDPIDIPTSTPTPSEPTPTFTPWTTATVVVSQTPEATETPIITPIATLDCGYIKVSMGDVVYKQTSLNSSEIFQYSGKDKKQECLDNLINESITDGAKIHKGAAYHDDHTVYYFMKKLNKLSKSRCVTAKNKNGSDSKRYVHLTKDGTNYVCINTFFYMDKACNVIEDIDGKEKCGDLTVSYLQSSPISLVFNDNEDISTNMTITRFNLDLEKSKNAWALWKASEKFPLLVYDKDHNGKIKDATQLFGNWTFGGKSKDSIIPWRNGYEALGILDKNYDGVLSDEELEPLALWFDKNRNAISDDGEVKSLRELNITKIYFTSYEQLAGSKDLVANVGYERIVDGKTITGKSIDWWTTVSDIKMDIVRSLIKEGEANGNKFTIRNAKINKNKIVKIQKDAPSFGGLWDYYLEFDEAKGKTYRDGLFAIFEKRDTNEILGYSFSERQLRGVQYDKAIFASYIEGSRSKENGSYIIKFESEYNGNKLKNKATLSPDNNRILQGETEVYDVEGKKIATYPWVAIRKKDNKY